MNTELEQLRIAYEELHMSPAEIATDRELDVVAVKAGLMQCSSAYRKNCGAELPTDNELNFSDQDLRDANEVIANTMRYGECPILRFKAATYVRDDKKGRKEVVKGIQHTQFNILAFNESMRLVKENAAKAKNRIVDVTSVPTNGH